MPEQRFETRQSGLRIHIPKLCATQPVNILDAVGCHGLLGIQYDPFCPYLSFLWYPASSHATP
jgi:hypothetical protein